jgi:acetoin utilization protein AcuB
MFVGDRMTHPVITIPPETPLQDALNLMHKEHIRRLPVVDHRGTLIGMVSELDLLHASPSDATSLSIWELNYLLSKVTVEKIMTKEVVTVTKDTPLEEAARIMADSKIGGLPVTADGQVVGIITETDLFKVFLELLGARDSGVRITALIANTPGELARLTKAVYEAGGNILALGTFQGESTGNYGVTLKVSDVKLPALKEAVESVVERLVDIREARVA